MGRHLVRAHRHRKCSATAKSMEAEEEELPGWMLINSFFRLPFIPPHPFLLPFMCYVLQALLSGHCVNEKCPCPIAFMTLVVSNLVEVESHDSECRLAFEAITHEISDTLTLQ